MPKFTSEIFPLQILRMKNYWIFLNHSAKFQVGDSQISDIDLVDILDIRVFKDHIFVQYYHADDAKKLISEARIPLIFKGNKLGRCNER